MLIAGQTAGRILYICKPFFVKANYFDILGSNTHTKFKFLQFFHQQVAIDKVYGGRTVSSSFPLRLLTKPTSRYDQTPIGPTSHCASEVSDLRRCNCAAPRIPLALEKHRETYKSREANYSATVYAAISRPACYLEVNEARFSQEPLAEPFKLGGIHVSNNIKQTSSPVFVSFSDYVGVNVKIEVLVRTMNPVNLVLGLTVRVSNKFHDCTGFY